MGLGVTVLLLVQVAVIVEPLNKATLIRGEPLFKGDDTIHFHHHFPYQMYPSIKATLL